MTHRIQKTRTFYQDLPGRGTPRGVAFGVVALIAFCCAVAAMTYGLAAAFSHWDLPVLPAYAVGGFFFLVCLLQMRTRVDVAPDGLRVQTFGVSRFIPIEAIRDVSHRGGEVTVRVRAVGRADEEELRFTQQRGSNETLAATLRAFLDAYRQAPSSTLVALLDRGDRSVAEWTHALRDLGLGSGLRPRADSGETNGGAGGYRVAAVPREELWQLVETASAPARIRVAAAVALEPTIGTERARLRAQLDTSALPAFRRGIASVLDEPNRVEESLAAMDEESAKRPARIRR